MSTPFSFDEAVFRALGNELGEDYAVEVLETFLIDTAGKVASLASDSPTRALVKQEAHSIKGSSATFGFNDLATLARELERCAETTAPAQLEQMIGELRETFEATKLFATANLMSVGAAVAT